MTTLVPIKKILKTKQPVMVEHIHQLDNNETRIYEINGYPIFNSHGEVCQIIEYNIDISDRKDLESQLLQAQKLEAVGILTGGVAHDFNNLLTSIIGYSQLALMKLKKNNPVRAHIEAVYEVWQQGS